MAMVESGFPVLAVIPAGPVFGSSLDLLQLLQEERGADLVVISDDQRALTLARSPIRLPQGIPEWLTPLVAIIPAQLFAYHLTLAKGYDPDRPRLIRKVTETH
jgi:glucosamine--fructose-6-phosphate aminotransferase (isomerizing)